MMHWGAIAFGMQVATAATALALGGAQSQPLPITVSLTVTVTDRASHSITDLQAPDFSVLENGIRQDVTSAVLGQAVALALLVDTSASMESKLAGAQEAAGEFVRGLRSQDLAEIIAFNVRPVVLQTLTNDAGALERAIRKTAAGGSTSLYSAIVLGLQDLKSAHDRNPNEIRRQVLVVLSDGADNSSPLERDDVLNVARRSDATIYAISLRDTDRAPRGDASQGAEAMRQFAQQTGGRAFFPGRMSDLSSVYRQVTDELSSQYTVGYTSKNSTRDGKRRRIGVAVNRPNLTIRAKQAYFAPPRIK